VTKFAGALVWLGGAMFVGSLAFCAYSYGVTWARIAAFSPAAAVFDAAIFSVFALHHSVFAREPAKRRLSAIVPEPQLRSVYVWLASLLLIAVCLAWQTVGGDFYRHSGMLATVHAVAQLAGIAIIAQAVRTIDPLELAGIRRHPSTDALQITGPYRWVRHPLYSGWLLLTFGAAHMTGDRLIFAGISTLYLLIAMPFEERSLRTSFGDAYVEYMRHVRYRIVPYVY
jgi:protein-S-isoprenylcysteine O-methyltransferase Ste14